MTEYAGIYLKYQIAEYAWFLNVSDSVIASGHCTNYRGVIETETYSEHSQTFKMEGFAKIVILIMIIIVIIIIIIIIIIRKVVEVVVVVIIIIIIILQDTPKTTFSMENLIER